MSKFKINFTLKQHTPIIHFQATQSGATLRATELKPKLDRFLKEFVFRGEIPIKYKINKEKDALNYKVMIKAQDSKIHTIKKDELFFGNMKPKGVSNQEWDSRKKFFLMSNKVEVEFFSFNKPLLKIIERYFSLFLGSTNFGARQSKGYGSFYLDINDPHYKKIEDVFKELNIKYYKFRTFKNWKKDISLFYKFLRQGINFPISSKNNCPKSRFYVKPAIFLFAKSKEWEWDKKIIKKKYFSHYLEKDIECRGEVDILTSSFSKKYLLRDLFGLSTSQYWVHQRAIIEKINKDIERFKSPITFKKIDNKIYFWVNESYKKILHKKFTIKVKGEKGLILSTPKEDEFDFDEFFNFVNRINLFEVVDDDFHKEKEFQILKRILYEIRARR